METLKSKTSNFVALSVNLNLHLNSLFPAIFKVFYDIYSSNKSFDLRAKAIEINYQFQVQQKPHLD